MTYRRFVGFASLAGALLGSAAPAVAMPVVFDFELFPDSAGCSQPTSSHDFNAGFANCDFNYINDINTGNASGHSTTVSGVTLELRGIPLGSSIDWWFGQINCGNLPGCMDFAATFSVPVVQASVEFLKIQDHSGSAETVVPIGYEIFGYTGPEGTGDLLGTAENSDTTKPATLSLVGVGPMRSVVMRGAATLFGGNQVTNLADIGAITVVPVPEPSTAALVGISLLGLSARRWQQ